MSEAPSGMAARSWLFVPGDSERKQTRALRSGADALILDLEDSVEASQRGIAREHVARLLSADPRDHAQLWVRPNAAASGLLREDLEAVCTQGLPAGVVLPKVSAADEIMTVAHYLGALESQHGVEVGCTRLLVIATETPLGLLNLPQYPGLLAAAPAVLARLSGLTWGAEDLGAALGSLQRRDAAGELSPIFQLARSTCRLVAAALGVQALDGACMDFRDRAGLGRELNAARRDGFSGKLAIHPDQVAPINAAFTPSAAECEHARRVLAAFAAAPGAGVVSLEGQMLDRPHLLQAQSVLARSQGGGRT